MTDPREVILKALAEPGSPAFTCSFQAEDMVVLDYLRKERPDVPVLFLETGYHFPETYEYRDRIAREWNLNLINMIPKITREAFVVIRPEGVNSFV